MKQQRRSSSSRGARSGTIGGLSLLGGAGLGAVLMYLLDPEAGRRRRERLADAAGHAASTTGAALGHAWEAAGDTIAPLAEHAAQRAAEYGAAGAAAASSLSSRLADRASERAHYLRQGAERQLRSARTTASGWFGHEEPSHLPSVGATISAAASLAAGVGLMYLLDPTDGPRRRTMLRDKATHCLSEAGDFFRKTGQHLRNRSRGLAAESRGMFRRDFATDEQIGERVRSRIGHLGQRSSVAVVVLDGRATLTGTCTPDDVDALLSTVQSTPGVVAIVNQLDVTT